MASFDRLDRVFVYRAIDSAGRRINDQLVAPDARAALQVSAESKSLRWIPLADLESVTAEVSVLRLRSAIVRCREDAAAAR
jgi:hypothetical protein